MEKNGTPQIEVNEHFQSKQRALIKRSIEMCVDIWEPFFLFNELFQKFVFDLVAVSLTQQSPTLPTVLAAKSECA